MTTMIDPIPWVRTTDGDWHVALGNLQLHDPTMATTVCHLRSVVCREDAPPSPRWHRGRVCPLCVEEMVAMGEPIPDVFR